MFSASEKSFPEKFGRWRALLWLAGCAFCSVPALAADEHSRFTVNGFGTLGVARTTSDDVEFVRDLTQPRGADSDWTASVDSVLGLQASWLISDRFQAAVQGMSRYRHDRTYRPEISWAFLKFDPVPNLSLRAGRLGTEFFMRADSRWVGYSFLTVRPPGDFFWFLPFYTIHGADLAWTLPVDDDIVRGKLFYGHSKGKIPLADEQWNIGGSPMVGGYLEYQTGPWQLRGSYANIRFTRDLPISEVIRPSVGRGLTAAEADLLATKGSRAHYYSLGVVYDSGPWQAQLMINHIDQGSKALENSAGGYAQLGYRIGHVTPYVGYSWVKSQARRKPVTADPVSDFVVTNVMQDSHADQKTTFLGARWDVARNVALTAQWDAIRGKPTSLFPYRRDERESWSGRLDVFSLALDFVF